MRGTSQWSFEIWDWKKSSPVVAPVAQRPKSEGLLLLAGAKPLNAEDATLYRSVTRRVGPSRLVICCRLSGTRDEKSHDEGPRGTQMCWPLLKGATGCQQLCLNHKLCLEFWKFSATQSTLETWEAKIPIQIGSHVGGALDQARERSAAHALGIKAMLNDFA